MSIVNFHIEEEFLNEIEPDDDWMEGLDLTSLDEFMEDDEEDGYYEGDEDEYWVH